MSFFYRIFGYNIESEFEIVQAPEMEKHDGCKTDISIVQSALTQEDVNTEYDIFGEKKATFSVDEIGLFRVTNGNLIEVNPLCEDKDRLTIFLTGSCMGAILHQRKEFVLHGSVVTDGKRTVLFTGESGAGKSTFAAQFCANGWKMLTDDVAVVKNPETSRLVQPSYPSQKLWGDSLMRFYDDTGRIHSLYKRPAGEKYGVNAEEFFIDTLMPLTDVFVIRKVKDQKDIKIMPVTGLEKIRLLMDNTYRIYMIARADMQQHFQRCVTLSQNINMAAVIRPDVCDPKEIYDALNELQ